MSRYRMLTIATVEAAHAVKRGMEQELVAKSLIVDVLPTTQDRSLALTYLMAWQSEPLLDMAAWTRLTAALR